MPQRWHVGRGLQEAGWLHPRAPGSEEGGEDTPRGWGKTGSTHQGDLEEQGQMPVAQGWYPVSCRSGHSFLCIFRSISLMREG